MANDYKPDQGKAPVMDAVLIPYRRTLLAIALMKADMAHKHKLQGARDPFLEWRQLPDAKRRMSNAGARHALHPWEHNTEDALPGTLGHLHIIHAIVGLMMAAEIHLEDLEKITSMVTPAKLTDFAPILERARVELRLQGEHASEPNACLHLAGLVGGRCTDCGDQIFPAIPPLHGPAGADWRERKQAPERGHFWTGDSATWLCTCGAGRPAACVCSRAGGDHS